MEAELIPWWDPRLAYVGDSNVRVRSYRRLQSRWREVELGLPPGKYVDRNGQERLLGSRLPEGSGPRQQLLSDEAVDYALARLPAIVVEGRKAEPSRLWLNMLSSQPLCFSLFGHLAHHREAGARVLDAVLPWAVDAIDEVLVEHAPAAAALALGGGRPDNTAFDAMLVVQSEGEQRVLGVETKYTEPFTQKRYDKPSYRATTHREGSWFDFGAAELAKEPKTNQLWRNVMLAQETAATLECRASVVVLTAARDHHAEQAVQGIKPLLVDADGRLTHTLLEDVVAAADNEPTLAEWARRFRERYLDLELADPPK
jgi:hypothetical protein